MPGMFLTAELRETLHIFDMFHIAKLKVNNRIIYGGIILVVSSSKGDSLLRDLVNGTLNRILYFSRPALFVGSYANSGTIGRCQNGSTPCLFAGPKDI